MRRTRVTSITGSATRAALGALLFCLCGGPRTGSAAPADAGEQPLRPAPADAGEQPLRPAPADAGEQPLRPDPAEAGEQPRPPVRLQGGGAAPAGEPRRDAPKEAPLRPAIAPPGGPEAGPGGEPRGAARPGAAPETPCRGRSRHLYGERGAVEIGGLVGLDWVTEGSGGTRTHLVRLSTELYAGWFVARRISLGALLVLNVSRQDLGDPATRSWGVSTGLLLAPGLAFPLGSAAHLYGDLLVGGFYFEVAGTARGGYAALGAELGVKVELRAPLILRIGLRPMGNVGRTEALALGTKEDLRQFALLLRVGLSGIF